MRRWENIETLTTGLNSLLRTNEKGDFDDNFI